MVSSHLEASKATLDEYSTVRLKANIFVKVGPVSPILMSETIFFDYYTLL